MDTKTKVRQFFASLRKGKWSGVVNARTALTRAHKDRRWPTPPFGHHGLADFWRGLRKACDNTQQGQDAIKPKTVRTVIAKWLAAKTGSGARNAFIAAVQFWGTRRISEVLRLTRRDIKPRADGGYTIMVRKQKNDPFGHGQRVPLPKTAHDGFDVSRPIRRFLRATEKLPDSQPLVRSIVKGNKWATRTLAAAAWNSALRKALKDTGIAERKLRRLSSHSLRKGGFTALVRAGAPRDCAQQLIGHKSAASANAYIRRPLLDLAKASSRI